MKNEFDIVSSDNTTNVKRKTVKGMTLAEVLISIAIMAVLALMLTTIGTAIDKYSKLTRAKNQKVTTEGPLAETQNREVNNGVGKCINSDYTITVTPSGGSAVAVKSKLYSVEVEKATDADGTEIELSTNIVDGEYVYYNGDTSGHFKFIYDPKVESTTGAST